MLRRLTRVAFLVFAGMLRLGLPVHAEESSGSSQTPAMGLDLVPEDGATSSSVGGGVSKLALEAATEKTTASFKIGRSRVLDLGGTGSSTKIGKLAMSAKLPFDASQETSKDVGTLSGLTVGTSAQVETGLFFWPQTPSGTLRQIDDVCNQAVGTLFPQYGWYRVGDPQDEHRYFNAPDMGGVSCEEILTSEEALRKAVAKRNELNKPKKATPTTTGGENGATLPVAVIPPNSREIQATYLRRYASQRRAGMQGVTLALAGNRQKLSYASAATPSVITEEIKYGYGASLAYTRVGGGYVLGAGLSWEKAYKGGKEQEICNPIGTTGSLACDKGSLDAPTTEKDEILFVEYRAWPRFGSLAWSPRVEYNFDGSDFGVRVPVFLVADPKRVLDGGIALGWTSDEHFTASVFISKSFTFFD